MVKKPKLVGVPKWLTLKPTDKMEKLIKDNSYNFIYRYAKQDGIDLKVAKLIPEYIAELNVFDAQFGKILPKQIKTTYAFIDAIRLELRNQKDKLAKEIADCTVTLKSDNATDNDEPSDDQDEVVEVEEEEEGESETEEHHEESNQQAPNTEQDEVVPAAAQEKPKISAQSKKIKKPNQKLNLRNLTVDTLDRWQNIAYMKEMIRGKQFELKFFQKKLQQMQNEELEESPPQTPPYPLELTEEKPNEK